MVKVTETEEDVISIAYTSRGQDSDQSGTSYCETAVSTYYNCDMTFKDNTITSGVEPVIDIVKNAVTDAWHFITKIASKVYRAVLDTVEAIVGALEWVFNAINTTIEKLIAFVKFLFEWDDIRRTKEVLRNMTELYLKDQVESLGGQFPVRVIVDALLDALASLANTMTDLFDNEIYIPVISEILEAISIPSISNVDMFSWIAATPSERSASILPHEFEKVVHIAGHAAGGFTAFTCCFLVGLQAEAPSGKKPFSLPAEILSRVGAALVGTADFLVPSSPVENTAVAAVAKVTTAASIISKVLICGPVQKKLAVAGSRFSALAVGDGHAASAIVDSIFVTG
ncbi:hypothetical protein GGS24DRAFT_516593 [Hypoxylon argillaceum]|nr:hypothetical protein GGS24DRAFT_516593 [Hypoxylon argillaceum]